MFQIIFAGILAIILVSKYYDWIVHKAKPDTRTILMMILCSFFVIAVFLEKIFHVNI